MEHFLTFKDVDFKEV